MNFHQRTRRRFVAVAATVMATFLGLASPIASKAQLTFSFNFTDAQGIGFNADGQTGADRRAALNQAANLVASYFTTYTATINMDVNGSASGPGVLASAGSNFNLTYPGTGFGVRGDVMTKILGGADPAPTIADGTVNWNFQNYQWATGNTIAPGEFDLISTGMHELTHAIGFAADISEDGTSPYGDPAGTASAWSPYAKFVSDKNGVPIINNATAVLDGARWNTAKVGGPNNGAFFNGPNAVAAFGGNPVPLYSPTTFSPGSSISHLDTDFFTGVNQKLMNHSGAPPGELDIRVYSDIEIAMLRDIGYTRAGLAAVPAPSSVIVLLCGGVPLIGVLRKRRKK